MAALATVDDVAARWHGGAMTGAQRARAAALIDDASALVLASPGFSLREGDGEQEANCRAVVCACVMRAMSAPEGMFGVTQASETAGPYTQSASYANATGDLYLTRAERMRLGIGRARLAFLCPGGAS